MSDALTVAEAERHLKAASAAHARAHISKHPDKIADAKRGVTEAKLRLAVAEALTADPALTAEALTSVARLLAGGDR